jgi:hypothetical protein
MSRRILYRVELEIASPLSDDPDDADYPTLEWAATSEAKRNIETSVLACLRRMEQECTNVEVMDFSVEDE